MQRQVGLAAGMAVVVGVVASGLVGCAPASATDAGPDEAQDAGNRIGTQQLVVVDTERIESPAWEPVDFRLIPVALGTVEDGYLGGLTAIGDDLAPNHGYDDEDGYYAPGQAHEGGYGAELAGALGDQSRTTFTVDQFTPPNGIVAMFTLVPLGAARGTSPDHPDGGVIVESAAFPIVIEGELLQGDAAFSESFARSIPAPAGTDGASHVVLGFPLSYEAAPEGAPVFGAYNFSVLMRDQTNQGWTVTMRFTVGTPCDCDDDCGERETCTPTPAGVSVCSASCSSGDALCPAGQTCVITAAGGDDVPGICQTSSAVLHAAGSVCSNDSECAEGICLAVAGAGRSVCRSSCDGDGDCPDLYACADGVCLLADTGTPCPVEEPPPSACAAGARGGSGAAPLALLALLASARRGPGRRRRIRAPAGATILRAGA